MTILGDLARQRETIVHARDTLHGADDNISKARRILSTMSKRVMTNKIIMFGIRWGPSFQEGLYWKVFDRFAVLPLLLWAMCF